MRRTSRRGSGRGNAAVSGKARRGAARGSAGGGAGRGFMRGAAGRDRVDEEIQRQKERREASSNRQPFSYWMPPGDTREVIVLDDAPDFFVYEHQLKDPSGGKQRVHITCPKEFDNCAACEGDKESTFIMVLTVIDLQEFEDRNGNFHEFSRKLFRVKPAQQKKFLRRHEKEGTLRGALFELSRDSKKDSVIGNDIEFIEMVDEEELSEYVKTYVDRDGKEQTEDCSQPFVYEEIFEEPDADKIRVLMGGAPTPGSRRANAEEGEGEGEEYTDPEDDDAPWDSDGEEGEETESDPDGDGEEEEERPRRGRRTRAAREEEEEERPRRRSGGSARRTARGAGSSRPRPATNRAATRRSRR